MRVKIFNLKGKFIAEYSNPNSNTVVEWIYLNNFNLDHIYYIFC